MEEQKKLNIFDYSDYREFLRDFFEMKKRVNPSWSYGLWSSKLGLNSISSITMVINGQRHAGKKIQKSLIDFFKFDAKESYYFEELVKIAKSTKSDPNLTILMLEQNDELKQLREKNTPSIDLFFNWKAHCVKELTQLKDFFPTGAWIENKTGGLIKKEEASELLEALLEKKFLIKEFRDGKEVIVAASSILPTKEVTLSGAHAYHKGLMENSFEAIKTDKDKRSLHATTLSLTKENIPKAKELIREFQIQFSEDIESSPGDEVYQLNIQFFPLTK
ncbi:TIGR02147 family protein [Halobacteriovorax sp. HLS]|uniref:TIGR02147 family protein n=1 Tax=Halobacteriovorax sp. HLS TaxID=2234000 RepID=UPI000FDBD5AB|nr:TIGR02147 family protein [Halobacteriovorax sp. HLS]